MKKKNLTRTMTGEEKHGGKQIRRTSENNTNGEALMLGKTHTFVNVTKDKTVSLQPHISCHLITLVMLLALFKKGRI